MSEQEQRIADVERVAAAALAYAEYTVQDEADAAEIRAAVDSVRRSLGVPAALLGSAASASEASLRACIPSFVGINPTAQDENSEGHPGHMFAPRDET